MALDFIHSSHAIALIIQLDDIIRPLGGDVYKTKDAFSKIPTHLAGTTFQSIQNNRYGSL